MNTRATLLLLLAALLSPGCLSFNTEARTYACEEDDDCLDGYSCLQTGETSICVATGSGDVSEDTGAGDTAVVEDTQEQDTAVINDTQEQDTAVIGDTQEPDTLIGDTQEPDTLIGDTQDPDTQDVDTDVPVVPSQLIFTTSAVFTGNLVAEAEGQGFGSFGTGVEAADGICSAIIGGPSVAVISTASNTAEGRVVERFQTDLGSTAFELFNNRGELVATSIDALFTLGPQATLAVDEASIDLPVGAATWTGPPFATGVPGDDTCQDWTEQTPATGAIGDPASDISWFGSTNSPCDETARLYCVTLF